ncbi:MAG: hypothetical protein ACREMA_00760 [Longimicrobiales bacterium]
MRSILVLAMAATIIGLVPNDAGAQRRRPPFNNNNDCCFGNRFYLEPYGGALRDAYDISADDHLGYLVGFRAGYMLNSRLRIVGNLSYNYAEDVADPGPLTNYYVYDNIWVVTTGGAEFEIVPGNTSAALGLQAGVAWRRLDLDGTVGIPTTAPESTDSYSAYEVLIPSITARQRLTTRASLVIGLHDQIFNLLEGTAKHSLALTLGASFR